MTDDSEFRSDCAECAAICCSAFAFEPSEDFPEAKPAGVACQHVTADFRCAVHDRRAALGFRGCIVFDCHGAGQAFTADFLNSGGQAADIAQYFPDLVALQKARHLLFLALGLALGPEKEARARTLLAASARPDSGWTAATLDRVQPRRFAKTVAEFLAGLKNDIARDV